VRCEGKCFRLIVWVQEGNELHPCSDMARFSDLTDAQEVAEFVLLHGNGVYIQILDESGSVVEVRRPGNLQ
jgi:hypothetical protein